MPVTLISFDERGRATIKAAAGHQYTLAEEVDGTLVLEPVEIVSRAEAALLRNTALMASIEDARRHPERRVARPPRRRPRGEA